jgi:hypothetical protein
MLLMGSARHAGCSPVCLDLSVGLSPSPPKMGAEMAAGEPERPDPHAGGCRMASSMTDEQVTDRSLLVSCPRCFASLLAPLRR